MAGGKHASDDAFEFDIGGILESINWIKILMVVTVIVVVGGAILCGKMVIDKRIADNAKQEPPVEPVAAVASGLPEELDGFEILGKIKIEKLNVEQYILNSTESEALEKGVSKLYGGELNDYGNFCISGHNYENVFEKLNELEVGDNFIIIDKDEEETNYEIKEIFQVEPDDLECLLSNDEKIEITLITCENGATTRLVAKAEKVEESEISNASEEDTVSDASETDNTVSNEEENV